MKAIQFSPNAQAKIIIEGSYKTAPKAFVHSFGCQQNVNDGEILLGVLESVGFVPCESAEEADIILYNTCAVREHAEQRVFGNIGALKILKEKNPRLLIAICGCMSQQKSIVDKLKKSYPYVDLVFGVNHIDELPQMICDKLEKKRKIFLQPTDRADIIEGMPVERNSKFRAWLPIMYGCDNYCSYCIVPYVRGRERSRSFKNIMADFKKLVAAGYKDITLLGQNVNSYGKGLDEKMDFAELLTKLDAVEGEYRLRFMTSHPKDANRHLIDTIMKSKHVCHHLHLPVQSGANGVLAKMNRRYTAEDYMQLISYAKQTAPDMTFSSDIIVGFPGETREDFDATLALIKQVEYMQLFTFIYSKRSGTPASEMYDLTPRKEKTDRMGELLAAQDIIAQAQCAALIGNTERVLVEGIGREDGNMIGRLDNNITAEFSGTEDLIGKFIRVKITGTKGAVLIAECTS